LAALGGAFGSSAISVDAYGKAPLYGQQKHEFLHIADKHVNREKRLVVGESPVAENFARSIIGDDESRFPHRFIDLLLNLLRFTVCFPLQ
jgi:phosphohistidine phosphatase SixA